MRFQRPQEDNNCITDLYDGALNREWVDNGFLANRSNISFCWYTDGVPVYKSSNVSMWLLSLTINELPQSERKKKENTLIFGIWFGHKKPHFNFFFYKMRSVIENLYRGIQVNLPNGNVILVRGIILMGTFDLPAKSDVLNFVQFNGKYGCPVCFIPGVSTRTGPRSSLQTYPYVNEIVERTSQLCIAYAEEARPGVPAFSVKGHTALSRIMPNFIKGMAIDRTHALDGGVMKKILTLCCQDTYSTHPCSLADHIEEINSRLKSIKPPKFVHRMPRSVDDLIHWKASEMKMFLFYYAIPVLNGIMKEEYFQHFLRLIVASAMLSSERITDMMIEVADDLLHRFVHEFEDLYGLQYCSINIHLLLHLPSCVRNLGPLWAYMCYESEDLNGYFLKTIHGTWHLESQIATTHNQCIKMVRYVDELQEGKVRSFCLKTKHQVKIIEEIGNQTYSVGSYKAIQELPEDVEQAFIDNGLHVDQYRIWTYFRLLKNKKLYVSELYTRHLQTSSSSIKYYDNTDNLMKYGIVRRYLRLLSNQCRHNNNCNCEYSHVAIIREIRCEDEFQVEGNQYMYSTAGFIYKCRDANIVKIIPINSIITPCFYTRINQQSYILVPINQKELE